MKNIVYLILVLLLLTSCKAFTSDSKKDEFINQFFNNNIVYTSLQDYYPEVIVYDPNKILNNQESNKNLSKIEIQNNLPSSKHFFRIHNFILNKDLAMVVLSTEDRQKGILFYLRYNSNKKLWEIMEITKRNSK